MQVTYKYSRLESTEYTFTQSDVLAALTSRFKINLHDKYEFEMWGEDECYDSNDVPIAAGARLVVHYEYEVVDKGTISNEKQGES